jgi:serine protease Do
VNPVSLTLMISGVPLLLSSPRPSATAGQYLHARGAVVRNALSQITPSIVTIETIGGLQPTNAARGATTRPARAGPRGAPSFRVADGPTTGLIWSADGFIITSSFNFVRDPSVITVVLADGSRHIARLVARDYIRRLALLKIDADNLPVPHWAPSTEIAVGQYAIACGRGFGGGQPAISVGIVSATRRHSGNAIQTDAKLSPANYGGPLIDIDGRVLGVCVPLAGAGDELAGVQWYDSGIGFAVPYERIQPVLDRLAAGEDIEPGKIGVLLQPALLAQPTAPDEERAPDETPVRVVIRAVASPSPAEQAGLQPGDVILKLNGVPVGELGDFQRRLGSHEAGAQITLDIERDGQPLQVRLRLARPAEIGQLPLPAPPTDEADDDDDEE